MARGRSFCAVRSARERLRWGAGRSFTAGALTRLWIIQTSRGSKAGGRQAEARVDARGRRLWPRPDRTRVAPRVRITDHTGSLGRDGVPGAISLPLGASTLEVTSRPLHEILSYCDGTHLVANAWKHAATATGTVLQPALAHVRLLKAGSARTLRSDQSGYRHDSRTHEGVS